MMYKSNIKYTYNNVRQSLYIKMSFQQEVSSIYNVKFETIHLIEEGTSLLALKKLRKQQL